MKNYRKFIVSALAATACSTSAMAFTVDGSLADWGINTSTWIPSAGIYYTIEDQVGTGSYKLNPGWGGQAYDAEAIYTTISGGKLFIALATGHNPTTSQNPSGNSYGAGDFALDFGKNGSYEVGINIQHNGTGSNVDPMGASSGVYQVSQWNFGLWNDGAIPGYIKSQHPTFIQAGSWLGNADLQTSSASGYGAYQNDLHYFYEMSLDLSLLFAAGWDGKAFNIHWTENCANDSILVDPPFQVPEPGTLALFGFGLAGLLGLRRRQRS